MIPCALKEKAQGLFFSGQWKVVFFTFPAFAQAAGRTIATAGGAFFPHMPDGQKYGGKDYNQDHGSSH